MRGRARVRNIMKNRERKRREERERERRKVSTSKLGLRDSRLDNVV